MKFDKRTKMRLGKLAVPSPTKYSFALQQGRTQRFERSKITQSVILFNGASAVEAAQANNPKVVGSNPTPATNFCI